MSRVFEALEKASRESKEVKEVKEVIVKPGNGSQLPAAGISSVSGFGLNGRNGAVVGAGKSWRERAEEMFFGRDLRNYESYPIVALEKGSPAAEQYKILREQVRGLGSQTSAYFLSVTSPIKRDGKSTVAVNLAVAMALEYEEKVLLIDCDLRNPQVHHYFGIQRNPGLTDYLTSSSNGTILNYVQETSLPGLQVLAAGISAGFSSELLAMEKMNSLMKEIRLKFPHHRVIIDSPPVLSTSDPLVLARHVDGILMVVRAGKTPRDCLTEAMQTLNSDKLVGIVLNGAELGMTSKYYDY
jgi:protein-tyrosine kinase